MSIVFRYQFQIRTNITQPCKSTYDICKFVDNYVKQSEGQTIPFGAVTMQVMRHIRFDTLYSSTNFDGHSGQDSHKYTFVKQVVEMYMKLKSVQLARIMTAKSHTEQSLRHHYRKLIQEAGQ